MDKVLSCQVAHPCRDVFAKPYEQSRGISGYWLLRHPVDDERRTVVGWWWEMGGWVGGWVIGWADGREDW